jgi:transcription initiation factor IIE alpha subunit
VSLTLRKKVPVDELKYNLEILSFQEKVALAELEEAKAHERVKELEYEKARFQMQWLIHVAQAQEKTRQQTVPPQQG